MKTTPLLVLCALSSAALAADYTWTGAADSDFANPANWLVGGAIPATAPANNDGDSGDNVFLPATPTANMPVLSANWNLRELRFLGSGWTFTTGVYTNKIGRFGVGLSTANTEGTNVFSGHLRLGSIDTPGPGWTIAGSGVLRVTGSIGRYAQNTGGGTVPKRGSGTLELETGNSTLETVQIEGGKVIILSGNGALDSNKSLTVNGGAYDLFGHNVSIKTLSGNASGSVTNGSGTLVTLTTGFSTSTVLLMHLSGALNITWGHNGTPYRLTFANPWNNYTGRTAINSGITAILRVSSPLEGPGAFGSSAEPVSLGTPTSGGGGTAGRVAAILVDGPHTVGKPVTIGTDKGRHVLGTTPTQTVAAVFSGNVMVGLGALFNGDNPHLELEVGTNAWLDLTGSITNALGIPSSNYALRNGKVLMLGPGVARLTGDNAYKGGTVISNGVLLASSTNALGLGGVVVAGGTLGGTCTVTGSVAVLAGATLTAGETNSVGTMTLKGGLQLAANSTLSVQLTGDTADCVRVTGGTLDVSAPVTVTVETLAKPEGGLRPVLSWQGTSSAAPALSSFVLSPDASAYTLVLRDETLYVRTPGTNGTLMTLE